MQDIICQSCAMPMTPEDYGTNADGSKNEKYCQYCFQNGKFTSEETLAETIETCVKYMTQDGNVTEDAARTHLQALLPGLERWKQA